jgi:hypothetical protein
MEWTIPRQNLQASVQNFRDFKKQDKLTKTQREQLLIKNNYSCMFCGGTYKKYLIGIYHDQSKTNDLCCRPCYLINHLNYGLPNEIDIYYSKLSQQDIIRKSVDFIIDNKIIPNPIAIDPNIQKSPISLLEFINILNNLESYPTELNNYKIFLNNNLNTDFLTSNFTSNFISFINVEASMDLSESVQLNSHILSRSELLFLGKFYAI